MYNLTVYGIKNCNTMKKCFDYLNQANLTYHFVDYKKQDIDFDTFFYWVGVFGLDNVINKQGTTYKKLDDNQKTIITQAIAKQSSLDKNELMAIYAIVIEHLSMIKRPIITGTYQQKTIALIGFDTQAYQQVLS